MNGDIRELFNDWSQDPEHNLRHVIGDDGREKIQLRVEQGPFIGILQMELDGRPDGKHPHNCDFALQYYEELVREKPKYQLNHKECSELFSEGLCVYERYSLLLQLSDFDRVVRDTEQNMRLFRFVNAHAFEFADRTYLERFWPYILRINATARAMQVLSDGDEAAAVQVIEACKKKVEGLICLDTDDFDEEKENSIEALTELAEQIHDHHEPSPREALEERLNRALKNEEYELAAILRDKLKNFDLSESTVSGSS